MVKNNSRNILFLLLIIVFFDMNSSVQITEIEKELKIVDELSRISQIKSISNEIKQANRKSQSCASQNSTKPTGKSMKINNNIVIKGNITSGNILAEVISISNNVNIAKALSSNQIITGKVSAQTTILNELRSPTGVITINGDVIVNNDIFSQSNVSGKSFIVDGVKQWSLAHHDDFEDTAFGWSDQRLNRCGEDGNSFLGGHCKFSFHQVSKTYSDLPVHNYLRINALFHMFDSWEGETAYMKVDGNVVWTKIGQYSPKVGKNICGGSTNDPAFALPIDAVVPHTNSSVVVTFSSTLKSDPCDASFGIDDVMVYVK